MLKNLSVLVTGGAGYIGSVLIRVLLKEGYFVTCVDNLMFGKESLLGVLNEKNFNFINCDINKQNELDNIFLYNNFHAVIHLAAIVGDPACKLYPDLANITNWVSSKLLIDKSKNAGVSKFIFASTCSNYGKMDNPSSYVDENSKLAPLSLYAELKVKFENYILSVINKDERFTPTCLRFSTVYGVSPRMRFDLTVNEFTKDLVLGKELIVFGEHFYRPYCHVKDFSNAIVTVLNSSKEKTAYNVFNVGDTSENYTKKMLVNEIVKILPNSKIKYVTKEDDPRDYRVNFDKIKNELGFKISMRIPDGILEIKRAIQENLIRDPEEQKYYNIPHEQK